MARDAFLEVWPFLWKGAAYYWALRRACRYLRRRWKSKARGALEVLLVLAAFAALIGPGPWGGKAKPPRHPYEVKRRKR